MNPGRQPPKPPRLPPEAEIIPVYSDDEDIGEAIIRNDHAPRARSRSRDPIDIIDRSPGPSSRTTSHGLSSAESTGSSMHVLVEDGQSTLRLQQKHEKQNKTQPEVLLVPDDDDDSESIESASGFDEPSKPPPSSKPPVEVPAGIVASRKLTFESIPIAANATAASIKSSISTNGVRQLDFSKQATRQVVRPNIKQAMKPKPPADVSRWSFIV